MKRQPSTKLTPKSSTDAKHDPMQGHVDRVRSDALMTGLVGPTAPAGARNPLVPLVRKRKAGAHEDRREKARLRLDQTDIASARHRSCDDA
jgi:hypothetical protein